MQLTPKTFTLFLEESTLVSQEAAWQQYGQPKHTRVTGLKQTFRQTQTHLAGDSRALCRHGRTC